MIPSNLGCANQSRAAATCASNAVSPVAAFWSVSVFLVAGGHSFS